MDPRPLTPFEGAALEPAGARAPEVLPTTLADPPGAPGGPPPRASYPVRHWRGELSLPVAYWVSSLLFTLAAVLAFAPLRLVSVTSHPRPWSLLALGGWSFFLVANTWLLVGIWRSARAHPSRGGSAFWASAARVVTVFGWLSFGSIAVFRVVPQVTEFGKVAFGRSELSDTRVRVIRDGAEVEVNGLLGFGIAEELRRALDANPGIRVVHLNSNGGRIAEAMELAKLIRERKLVTYVATQCLSACVTAFAAGEERWISRKSVLGLHAPSMPGMTPEEVRAATAEERRFLESRGIDRAFLARGFQTAPDDMWRPPNAEVLKARLATGFAPENSVGISGASAHELEEVGREISRVRVYAVLQRTHPDVHAAIVREFEEGFRRGRSLEEIRAATFPKVAAVFTAALPRAPDPALRGFADLLVAQARALQRSDPRHCAALLDGSASLAVLNLLPEELRKRDLEVQADVIEGASATPQPTPTVDEMAPRFPVILAAMSARARKDMSLLNDPAARKAAPDRYCDAAVSLYAAILTRPDAEAGPMLRALLGAGAAAP
ncbi:MAG TPA: hypothetical protein VF841_02215 [Anaeromyxobacter sp.]